MKGNILYYAIIIFFTVGIFYGHSIKPIYGDCSFTHSKPLLTSNMSIMAIPIVVNMTTDIPCPITLSGGHMDPTIELIAEITDPPVHGILSNIDQESGNVTYATVDYFVGNDSFSYRVSDRSQFSDPVEVDILIRDNSTSTDDKDLAAMLMIPGHLNQNNTEGPPFF